MEGGQRTKERRKQRRKIILEQKKISSRVLPWPLGVQTGCGGAHNYYLFMPFASGASPGKTPAALPFLRTGA